VLQWGTASDRANLAPIARGRALDAETVLPPRDAFFGPVEIVPVAEVARRISAELITPYPPGIPGIFPGERINAPVLNYLRRGVAASMVLPDS
jgi:arginine decarboxylase